jgi:hypothetical protein
MTPRSPTSTVEVSEGGRDDRADAPELWAIDRRALDVAFAERPISRLRALFAAWGDGIRLAER